MGIEKMTVENEDTLKRLLHEKREELCKTFKHNCYDGQCPVLIDGTICLIQDILDEVLCD